MKHPLKILVLFSGSASSLQYLSNKDPNYGKTYEIVCGIANKKDTKGETFCKDNNIPFVSFNTKIFCMRHGYEGKLKDMPKDIRQEYYSALLAIIRCYEPDMILLSGFMLEITEPLIGYRPIINVHPADLRIKETSTGKPKYIGANPVTKAIKDKQTFTASTIHVVEPEVDCGKIICVSEPLFVEEGVAPHLHQEAMKMKCDGPAYKKALDLITSGAFVF